MKNQPYKRGVSPAITKENPYISGVSENKKKVRKSNNRKGNGLVVARVGVLTFAKYRTVKQQVKNGLIVHSVLV